MKEPTADLSRRFSGIKRLYGETALNRFQNAHVCVVGIGGGRLVGSGSLGTLCNWADHLIDLDMVAESNVRLGKSTPLATPLAKPRPTPWPNAFWRSIPHAGSARLRRLRFTRQSGTNARQGFDYVIDAIDNVHQSSHDFMVQSAQHPDHHLGGRWWPDRPDTD